MNLLVPVWILFLSSGHLVDAAVEYAPIVQLKSGKVRGLVQDVKTKGQVQGHNKVHVYEGIRYGRAERFGKPKSAESWTDVYNATKWRDACPQAGVGKAPQVLPYFTETMSEDCLFVSVWRPSSESVKPRAVMVWIHGGGYHQGTIFAFAYDCRYLAAQGDVVMVSVNYRLGAFGFMFGGKEAPGNVGLHDQILALHWVKENIAAFGGDPNMVTIFGESAGSFAVGSLILSPLGKGLFSRTIMQSGGPNSYYGRMSPKEGTELTQLMAHALGCPTSSIDSSVQCLKHNKSIDQILSFAYLPTIDPDIDRLFKPIYGDDLLPLKPEEALISGKFNHDLELLYGVTSREGSSFIQNLVHEIKHGQALTLLSTEEAIKHLFKKDKFSSEVAAFYTVKLRDQEPTQDQLKIAIADAFGDYHLVCPTMFFAEQFYRFSSNHSIYSYRLTRSSLPKNLTDWTSVRHTEDLNYLFMVPLIDYDPNMHQLSNDMIHAWTEFAKHGRPHVGWSVAFDASKPAHQHLMNLDPEHYMMVTDFYKQTCDNFWKSRMTL